ncbi:ABC transporter substrate-binding protein [Oerskovia flava]|uniref:ABC transporter substrate-binding protein n=1 Tax=Oerskovia flava TaxID=2986422 RepID=UPI00223FA3C5|nr:ABC transporter substrate-binding protein [Oerskovia sp. JB1-3-2]
MPELVTPSSWSPSRRDVLRLGGLGALALALTACGGPTVGGTGSSTPSAGTGIDWSSITPASEITWWSNHPGASKEVEEELIRRFTAQHPEISVRLVTAGAGYDEIAQRFQAASGTDNLPDLVIASDVWWFRYMINGQIMPVDEIFAHLEVDVADYNPTLYGDYSYDGKHWAAPYARSMPLFYYNKEMWAAAGLPDRGPETWAELEEWAPALREQVPADGAPLGLGTGTSWSAWWFANMLWGQGGQYSQEWTVTLETPEAVAAGQFVHDLFHAKEIAAVGTDTNADFAAGVFASVVGTTGSLTGLLDTVSFDLGAAYMPDGPAGTGVPTGGTGLAIPSSRTPEQQLAAAMFLAFMTDPENTAYFSQSTGYMPVRTSAQEGETMSAIYDSTPQYRTAVDQLATKARSQDWARVFVPSGDQILTDGIEEIVLKGTDPAEALAALTPRLERAFRENVEPYL